MDIVILANFCGDMSGKGNGRFLYLAEMLAKEHDVEIVTSDFDHGEKAYRPPMRDGLRYRVTMLHESGYPKNVCLQRFASHYTWGKNVKKYLQQRKKPDVIYCAVPSLTGPMEAAKYCRKNGVRFVVDVQDLWPEAFKMVLNIPVISDIAFAPLQWMADKVYATADGVAAVSRTYVDRVLRVNRKCTSGVCVFLGTRLEDFDAHAAANPVDRKEEKKLWLGYCGTLGTSYDLITVFDALDLLRQQGHALPVFVVMGDGSRKAEFEAYAQEKQLPVHFTGRLNYDVMCGWIRACDMVVNPIIGSSAASIINKHADYAACGRPVLNTQTSPEYRDLVDTYDMGFNCRSEDPADLAQKLQQLMDDPALRERMGRGARNCAEERFDRKTSYESLVNLIVGE